jgi:hypothetical protein
MACLCDRGICDDRSREHGWCRIRQCGYSRIGLDDLSAGQPGFFSEDLDRLSQGTFHRRVIAAHIASAYLVDVDSCYQERSAAGYRSIRSPSTWTGIGHPYYLRRLDNARSAWDPV